MILFLLILTALSGVFFYRIKSSPLDKPIVYNSNKNVPTFQISPPKGWTFSESSSIGNFNLVDINSSIKTFKDKDGDYTYSANIDVSIIEESAGTDLDSLVTKYKGLIENSSGQISFLKDERVTVNGQKGRVLEFVDTPTRSSLEKAIKEVGLVNEDLEWHLTQKVHKLYYFFLVDGFLYAVSGISLNQHWAEFETETRSSLNSFKLLNLL